MTSSFKQHIDAMFPNHELSTTVGFIQILLEIAIFSLFFASQIHADAKRDALPSCDHLLILSFSLFGLLFIAYFLKWIQELWLPHRATKTNFFVGLFIWVSCLLCFLTYVTLILSTFINQQKSFASDGLFFQTFSLGSNQSMHNETHGWEHFFHDVNGEYIIFLLFAIRHVRTLPSLGWQASAFRSESVSIDRRANGHRDRIKRRKLRTTIEMLTFCFSLISYFFLFASLNHEASRGDNEQVLHIISSIAVGMMFITYSVKYCQEMFVHRWTRRRHRLIDGSLWILALLSAALFLALFIFSLYQSSQTSSSSPKKVVESQKFIRKTIQNDCFCDKTNWSQLFSGIQGSLLMFLLFLIRNFRQLPSVGAYRSVFLHQHAHLHDENLLRENKEEEEQLLLDPNDDNDVLR